MSGVKFGLSMWLAIMLGVWSVYVISVGNFPFVLFASVLMACLAGHYFEQIIRGGDGE